MQVARDDDEIEPGSIQHDAGRLEVDCLDADVELEPHGVCAQPIERILVAIDGRHHKARGRQQQRVTAPPTGHVERLTSAGQQVDVVHEPRRRPRHRRQVKGPGATPSRHAIGQFVHGREPGLCQQAGREPAANRVLAADEHRPIQVVEHGRRARRQMHRQEPCAGDVSERRELVRRPDVEHGGAGVDQRRRLLAGDAPDLGVEAWIQLHAAYSIAAWPE